VLAWSPGSAAGDWPLLFGRQPVSHSGLFAALSCVTDAVSFQSQRDFYGFESVDRVGAELPVVTCACESQRAAVAHIVARSLLAARQRESALAAAKGSRFVVCCCSQFSSSRDLEVHLTLRAFSCRDLSGLCSVGCSVIDGIGAFGSCVQ
jgi:hypothetical protein